MERLLDFSQPFDVAFLDQVISIFYNPSHPERNTANQVLMALQEHVEAWKIVDSILEKSAQPSTKFFGLQILEDTIKYRWKALPAEQREGIKNYVVQKCIKLSQDDQTLARERTFVKKLNLSLVQILKQEWPHNWPNFITELVGSSQSSEALCENNMYILKLLSEEVFDFSKEEMTSTKIKTMKERLNEEFTKIFQLCELVLSRGERPSLLSITLQTLLRFLSWIPLGYIFETKLIEQLLSKFFPVPQFRNDALACLTEIGSIDSSQTPQYAGMFDALYRSIMEKLVGGLLPPMTDIRAAYESASESDCVFVQRLSIFFTGFFTAHIDLLEQPQNHQLLSHGMLYLVKISEVEDPEIFKICLEFWNKFTESLFKRTQKVAPASSPLLALGGPAANGAPPSVRMYSEILSKVREVMIHFMAKPEEVLVVEDENGEIVRETTKDTDAIAQYKMMRETLVYLTHLDYDDTENIMLSKLNMQCEEGSREFSWQNLNTLCWAIGSVSGAMNEEDEKRFLVTVIKDLLGLCEMKRGKENKAVIASNIMYVVGQYPRFLRAHWKFLKTVVNKLFEFMHELHPGVQDMACDTFLKIAQKCKKKFVVMQQGEHKPFIEELFKILPSTIGDLEPHQVHTFYESCAHMVSAQTNPTRRDHLLLSLMAMPNNVWSGIMQAAKTDASTLQDAKRIAEVLKIVRTNVRVCRAMGHTFITQLGRIYMDMLNVYKTYSECISHMVRSQGAIVTKYAVVRSMRGVKKEILKLIEVFVSKSEDPQTVAQIIVAPLYEMVLADYNRSVDEGRDPEVLGLFTVIVNKLRGEMSKGIHSLLQNVFNVTLGMITKNFEDYPEHRIKFYKLIKAINDHCFEALFGVSPEQQKNVVDSIVWAFKHTERNIADTGLEILYGLFKNLYSKQAAAQPFYQSYLLNLLQDVLYVLTDRLHKSGFKMHSTILKHVFYLIQSGHITVPLFDVSTQPAGTTNQQFICQYVVSMISNAFQNMSPQNVNGFVTGLFALTNDLNGFKGKLRDFLVELKEFSGEDNAELFTEENEAAIAARRQQEAMQKKAIPGLLNPHEVDEDDFL